MRCWSRAKAKTKSASRFRGAFVFYQLVLTSERQVVIIRIKRCGRRCWWRRGSAAAVLIGLAAHAVHSAAAGSTTKHHQVTDDNVGPVARLAGFILGLRVLDRAFDVQAIALVHVLLDDVCGAVPSRAAVPLCFFLLLSTAVSPLAVRCERELCDLGAAARRAELGLRADVADQHDFVERTTHL